MASIVKPILDQASGAAGSTIWSRNGSGKYTRVRVGVTQPQTTAAIQARARFAALGLTWRTNITSDERMAWADAASTAWVRNRLGREVRPMPWNLFVAVNYPRRIAGLAFLRLPPPDGHLTAFPIPGISSVTASRIFLTFDNTKPWAGAVGGFLNAYVSPHQPTTHRFHATPYQFRGLILGAGTPPTSPKIIGTVGTVPPGRRVFVTCMVQDNVGRRSVTWTIFADRPP